MKPTWMRFLQVELATAEQKTQLLELARQRRWGLALLLLGWLHLAVFLGCHYLTIVQHCRAAPPYLALWLGELCGMGLLFRLCGGPRSAQPPPRPLELFVRRVWLTYFVLAFNLASLNTLRGHIMFEFFPAMATLASFAFLMMTVVLDGRFFAAVLSMFASGLLMAAFFLHCYLIFAVTWWLVLEGIGLTLLWTQQRSPSHSGSRETRCAAEPRLLPQAREHSAHLAASSISNSLR